MELNTAKRAVHVHARAHRPDIREQTGLTVKNGLQQQFSLTGTSDECGKGSWWNDLVNLVHAQSKSDMAVFLALNPDHWPEETTLRSAKYTSIMVTGQSVNDALLRRLAHFGFCEEVGVPSKMAGVDCSYWKISKAGGKQIAQFIRATRAFTASSPDAAGQHIRECLQTNYHALPVPFLLFLQEVFSKGKGAVITAEFPAQYNDVTRGRMNMLLASYLKKGLLTLAHPRRNLNGKLRLSVTRKGAATLPIAIKFLLSQKPELVR